MKVGPQIKFAVGFEEFQIHRGVAEPTCPVLSHALGWELPGLSLGALGARTPSSLSHFVFLAQVPVCFAWTRRKSPSVP